MDYHDDTTAVGLLQPRDEDDSADWRTWLAAQIGTMVAGWPGGYTWQEFDELHNPQEMGW